MRLPNYVDLTPEGKIVKKRHYGQRGYIENSECELMVSEDKKNPDLTQIKYYCEDDYFLTDKQVEYIILNRKKLI
jgi:hypothetical protein